MMKFLPAICLLLALTANDTLFDGAAHAAELDRIVAVINDDVITRTELDNAIAIIKRQLAQSDTRLPPADVLDRQVLERMIGMRMQLQLAERTGIRVDDTTLNRTVGVIAEQNRLSLSEFREVLEQDGFSFEKFREDMRDEIIISRLNQRQIENQIVVSEGDIERFLDTQKTQGKATDEYRLAHILVAVPESASPDRIQDARKRIDAVMTQLRQGADFGQTAMASSDSPQALEGGDLGWRKAGELPTLFASVVPRMAAGDISEVMRSPSGFHIIKLIDQRGAERLIVTQTHARHILLKPNELVPEEAVIARLEDLRDQVLAGTDFAELASRHSADTASAKRGGDLGWLSPGDTVPAFEKTMNALAAGEISAPVQSNFGWHIIQALERREHDDTDDSERNKARDLIRKRKIDEETQAWLRRLRDETFVEYRL
jgi:peptidyl-prolyl cis-trans isomerase SurA